MRPPRPPPSAGRDCLPLAWPSADLHALARSDLQLFRAVHRRDLDSLLHAVDRDLRSKLRGLFVEPPQSADAIQAVRRGEHLNIQALRRLSDETPHPYHHRVMQSGVDVIYQQRVLDTCK